METPICSHMERGILEVLLVRAQGIRHTNLYGTPVYYVTIQCGSIIHESKVTSGKDDEARWNQKFRFELPLTDWRHCNHLKCKIMDKEFFRTAGFVGETIIYLKEIIAEGVRKGITEVKPAPYNVVLEDDTYKGEIRIGLNFITNIKQEQVETETSVAPVNESRQSLILPSIINLLKSSWLSFWVYCKRLICKNKLKDK